jgi:nucleolar complex protein 3
MAKSQPDDGEVDGDVVRNDTEEEGEGEEEDEDELDLGFASSFIGMQSLEESSKGEKRANRKRKKNENASLELSYESRRPTSRGWDGDHVTSDRLPVKDSHGRILENERFLSVSETDEAPAPTCNTGEGETNLESEVQPNVGPVTEEPQLPTAERRAPLKLRIAELCDSIVQAPEKVLLRELKGATDGTSAMPPLSELHALASRDVDPVIRQLATLSEFVVFKDILPDYRIRPLSQAEKSAKVSKDVKRRRNYESILLSSYQSLLKHLEDVSSKNNGPAGVAAVRCMCELLLAKPYFNFSANLVAALVPRASHKLSEIRSEACDCFVRIFRQDAHQQVIVDIVKSIAKHMKTKSFRIHDDLVRVLLVLPLQVHQDELPAVRQAVKRKKKQQKAKDVDAELQESVAAADADFQKKQQAEVLHEVILIYFRILKGGVAARHLLPASVEGLARIVHLINLDTAEDMLDVLRNALDAGCLSTEATLQCVLLAFTALSGPGKELQRDEVHFLRHLYRSLTHLSAAHVPLACRCLDAAFLQRREFSDKRVAAFVKRSCIACTQLDGSSAFDLLVTVHAISVRYSSVRQMFDDEEDRVTSGTFDATGDDPDAANALSTSCWELDILKKSIHVPTRQAAEKLRELGNADNASAASGTAFLRMLAKQRDDSVMASLHPHSGANKGNTHHSVGEGHLATSRLRREGARPRGTANGAQLGQRGRGREANHGSKQHSVVGGPIGARRGGGERLPSYSANGARPGQRGRGRGRGAKRGRR